MYYCYLLKSLNDKHLDQTYIGFTDDPIKRLRQHNGIIKGGAKKTSFKRPWALVLVISNFPNKILALKFEWAWTNPFVSKFTSDKTKDLQTTSISSKNKKKGYTTVDFKLQVLNILINSKVYDKISLYLFVFDHEILKKNILGVNCNQLMELATESSFKDLVKNRIYYYNEEYTDDAHYGEFSDKCLYCEEDFKREGEVIIENDEDLCENLLQDEIKNQTKPKEPSPISKCPKCGSLFHMTCLALNSIDKGQLIPKVTACLICSRSFPWSEWIK